jgi:hypothetical protein
MPCVAPSDPERYEATWVADKRKHALEPAGMGGLITNMKRPVVIAAIVCVSCFLVAAIFAVMHPDCGQFDDDCRIEFAPYFAMVLVSGGIGSAIAISLCLYGINVVVSHFLNN